MIKLYINPNKQRHCDFKDILEKLAISRAVFEDIELEIPVLQEHQKVYTGVTEIETFLESFTQFHQEWYACTCDKFDWLE